MRPEFTQLEIRGTMDLWPLIESHSLVRRIESQSTKRDMETIYVWCHPWQTTDLIELLNSLPECDTYSVCEEG